MESFDLKCEVKESEWEYIEEIEYCYAQNVNITSRNQEITSVNGRTEPTSLEGLWINFQTAHYLPTGIDKFFPNLLGLDVQGSKLKSVTQDDLKPLTQLEYVSFWKNDLESLDGDLFKFNSKLQYVAFFNNKLNYVGENLLSNLKDLKECVFNFNPCISAHAHRSSQIPELVDIIKTECSLSVLISKNVQLKRENVFLKNQTNQQRIELNSKIILLKTENENYKRLLKICDGNLNAVC